MLLQLTSYSNLQSCTSELNLRKLISSDFRSNDRIQKRLVEEISRFSGQALVYTGGRRGGASDVIARRPNLISSDSVAQSLTAFHGRPDIGYKFKSRIWEENEDYKRVFNDKTSAQHILFVYSLFKEILNIRNSLKKNSINGEGLKDIEQKNLDFFNARGSVFVLIYAVSKSIEIFLSKRVDDKFDLAFAEPDTVENYQTLWNPIISLALSFSEQLLKGLQNYSLTMDNIEDALSNFNGLVQAVAEPNRKRIEFFAERVSL